MDGLPGDLLSAIALMVGLIVGVLLFDVADIKHELKNLKDTVDRLSRHDDGPEPRKNPSADQDGRHGPI